MSPDISVEREQAHNTDNNTTRTVERGNLRLFTLLFVLPSRADRLRGVLGAAISGAALFGGWTRLLPLVVSGGVGPLRVLKCLE